MWRIISRQLTDNLPLKQIASGLISELANFSTLISFLLKSTSFPPLNKVVIEKERNPAVVAVNILSLFDHGNQSEAFIAAGGSNCCLVVVCVSSKRLLKRLNIKLGFDTISVLKLKQMTFKKLVKRESFSKDFHLTSSRERL